jgi:lysophospholipase L1-like esterase
MKTVMCYGDSLTWGYNPSDGTRYPFEQRWPGVLQHELGGGVHLDPDGHRALALAIKNVVAASLTIV